MNPGNRDGVAARAGGDSEEQETRTHRCSRSTNPIPRKSASHALLLLSSYCADEHPYVQ
jgi:hypothetical protein